MFIVKLSYGELNVEWYRTVVRCWSCGVRSEASTAPLCGARALVAEGAVGPVPPYPCPVPVPSRVRIYLVSDTTATASFSPTLLPARLYSVHVSVLLPTLNVDPL